MKICHYTTIESLVLILSNKTIKFSRLDKVDDLDEGKIEFRGTPLSHIFFASCWSMEEEESIAMWKLYTREGVGVRIKLESDTIFDNQIFRLIENPSKDEIINLLGNKHYLDTLNIIDSPVTYVPNPLELINESIRPYGNSNDTFGFAMDNRVVGLTKDTSWSFQKEYRFLKMILPRDHKTTNISPGDNFNIGWQETYSLLQNGHGPERSPGVPLEEVFVPLGTNALAKLEITLGPNCKEEHKLIVEAICNQLGIKAKIAPSGLTGRLHFK